jgi:uncharacterized metal-binding protein
MATTDPAFNRFLLWDAPTSVAQLSERIKVILDERRKGQMGAWVAADISTGAFMALFRAYTVHRRRVLTNCILKRAFGFTLDIGQAGCP